MRLDGRDGEFVVIGENIHTTRVVLRKGKLVVKNPAGVEAVRFYDTHRKRRFLAIPEDVKRTRDYEEGRVKYVKIALHAAMSGREPHAGDGLAYLHRLVQRQVDAAADYLDLNVDEVSLRLDDQKASMQWLVRAVQEVSPVPLSVDSSNVETIQVGLEACDGRAGRALLNSASLERLEALDLARRYNSRVIVTAAGGAACLRTLESVSPMRHVWWTRRLPGGLVFRISSWISWSFRSRWTARSAITASRRSGGFARGSDPEIHVTGGFSNVSFGLPCRRLINDVFTILAVEAGADSGIVDPVTSSPQRVFSMDRETEPYRLAEDMLQGRDPMCKSYLRAYRKGALDVYR